MAELISPYNPKNPSGKASMSNCVACVASCLRHRILGDDAFVDALEIDRVHRVTQSVFGSGSPKDALTVAVGKIVEATGLRFVPNDAGRPFRDVHHNPLPAGHYAVFLMGRSGQDAMIGPSETVMFHVIYGRKDHDGHGPFDQLYDPQSHATRSMGHLVPPTYAVLFTP